ncbi:DUF5995 family protein [Blastococcus deserti]|uniref:DUF5995 family protein n=1 Tax=Blastococcus deserti TaxID=2259033 RepID=A0ABW4X5H2_9ACTN
MTGPRRAETIDDVLEALREVVDDSLAAGSRVGYFAALYRQVTVAVARGIDEGVFDDGERMSRLDAAFANRYFEALDAWRSGGRPSRSWRTAFRATDEERPVLVQHLALGVNAHINLDLPVVCARMCPGDAIMGLRRDFDLINGILTVALGDLQTRLAVLSPLLGALDVVLGRLDEEIVGFNVRKARSEAWDAAVLLARQEPEAQEATEKMLDRYASGLARVVLAPPFPLPAALDLVRATERAGVQETLRALDG